MDIYNSCNGKIIYFDQKGWIDLAKIYYGNPTPNEKELLEKILQASDKETAVFPFSLANMTETASIRNPRWRKELAFLIIKISKYHTLNPYLNRLLELEIENLILDKVGLPLINIRRHLVRKGFSWLMGASLIAASETLEPRKLEELNLWMQEKLDDPKTFEFLISKHRYHAPETKKKDLIAVKTFERIRKKLKRIKDNEMRRKASFLQNTYATVFPKFAQIAYDLGVPVEFVKKYFFTNFDIDEFIEKLPTALCLFTLLFQRDQQLARPIKLNDIEDIWHLTLSIPHCDIVVTENMWASIAKSSKLDQKCNTVILSYLRDLGKFL